MSSTVHTQPLFASADTGAVPLRDSGSGEGYKGPPASDEQLGRIERPGTQDRPTLDCETREERQ